MHIWNESFQVDFVAQTDTFSTFCVCQTFFVAHFKKGIATQIFFLVHFDKWIVYLKRLYSPFRKKDASVQVVSIYCQLIVLNFLNETVNPYFGNINGQPLEHVDLWVVDFSFSEVINTFIAGAMPPYFSNLTLILSEPFVWTADQVIQFTDEVLWAIWFLSFSTTYPNSIPNRKNSLSPLLNWWTIVCCRGYWPSIYLLIKMTTVYLKKIESDLFSSIFSEDLFMFFNEMPVFLFCFQTCPCPKHK